MIFDKIRVRKEKKRIELVSAERLALSGLVEETQNYIDSHKLSKRNQKKLMTQAYEQRIGNSLQMAQHYGSLGIIDPVTITINLNEHVIPRSKFDADNYISDAKKNAKKAKIIISKTRINHILLDTYVSIRNKAKQYYERYKEEEYLEMVKNYDEKINGLNSSDEDTKVISLDEITR